MRGVFASCLWLAAVGAEAQEPPRVEVGPRGSRTVVTTGQEIEPAGETIVFGGRPVDLAMTPDGSTLLAKDSRGLVVFNAVDWKLQQELAFDEDYGGSMHGIAVSRDGQRAWLTTAQNRLYEAQFDGGKWTWKRWIALPGPGGEKDASHGCGLALSSDERTAYVCLSRNNALAIVDLEAGKVTRTIDVGVAPYDVLLVEGGHKALVSNWGGRRARSDDLTAPSSGTPVVVDERGVAVSGTVMWVDLDKGQALEEIETGLHACQLIPSADGRAALVANANADTVAALQIEPPKLLKRFELRPQTNLPFGSAPNALALAPDGRRLFVALARNNAIAVVDLSPEFEPHLAGLIPTGWYPGAVVLHGSNLFVANVRGIGSRQPDKPGKFNSHDQTGSVSRIPLPDAATLAGYTERVAKLGRQAEIVDAMRSGADAQPVPVPRRPGEPSPIEHVIYVIKENRTYDQVFGDLPQGNGMKDLCIFGREITPNHHALAEQFVLLDNFYCNGVLSADGHSWATEGNVTDHLEKSFGGFTRSYTFGDDPLTYSASGFIWDGVLGRGRTVRNFGEMDDAKLEPSDATFLDVFRDWRDKTGKITSRRSVGIARLRAHTSDTYPGWNMKIPDQLRIDAFLVELAKFEKSGDLPNFVLMHLPQDHTSGTSPGMPTPAAHVADNDLAVGRLVEALSHSRFWPKTAIFIVEDDPQDGFDHVDGHRTVALVASPYTKRGAVVSDFYNQTAMLHTMELILGLPPMNQMDAMATPMWACFQDQPDLRPYEALPESVPLDQMNPEMSQLQGRERELAEMSLAQPLEELDAADEDTFNRILWHAMRGVDAEFPTQYAGAHGRGLSGLGLLLSGDDEEEEEEEREEAERRERADED